jgi:hypothetical protein
MRVLYGGYGVRAVSEDYQPYFLAYLLHTDADPGDVAGYILWISSKWREWRELNGLDRWAKVTEEQRKRFETWLFETVPECQLEFHL